MPAGVVGETVKLDGPEGAQDLARVVRANMGARHSSMTLRLDPPELGAVRVDVRMHDAAMTVRFQAQTEAGCDALQGRLRELAGALEGQGIRLDRVEVEYRPPPPPDAPRDDQGYSRQQSGQQWGEPRFTGGQGRSEGWQSPASVDYSAETRGGGTRELESDGVQLDKMGVNVVI
jgi:flagellar hook-length control protein FliK